MTRPYETGIVFPDIHVPLHDQKSLGAVLDYARTRRWDHAVILLEVPHLLKLEARGVQWVPYWSTGKLYKVGKLYFAHGRYAQKHHAFKHVDTLGVNVVYGHTHDVQQFSKELMGNDSTLSGQSLGCLCLYKQPYLKGNPTRWQHAFGEFDVFPDGYFNFTVTRLFKHRFVGKDGEVYSR